MICGLGPGSRLRQQDACGEEGQDQAEACRQDSVQRRVVLQVDCPGEGLVSHERHRAEVAQGIESRKQRAGGNGGPQQGKRDPPEGAPCRVSQAPGGLLQRGVHPRKSGLGGEKHVGEAEQGQCKQGSGEAVDLRQPLDSEGAFQRLLEHPPGAKGNYYKKRPDVAWDYQGEGGKDRPCPAKGQIGASDEPGQGNRHEDARRRDCGNEKGGPKDDLEGSQTKQKLPELCARTHSADEQVRQRKGDGDGHQGGGAHQDGMRSRSTGNPWAALGPPPARS